MKVIYKPVGAQPFEMDIDKTLEQFQSMVDGYFEYVMVTTDLAIICNENGRLMRMPYNCTILGHDFVGPVFFVGVGRKDWKDCPVPLTEVKKMIGGE